MPYNVTTQRRIMHNLRRLIGTTRQATMLWAYLFPSMGSIYVLHGSLFGLLQGYKKGGTDQRIALLINCC